MTRRQFTLLLATALNEQSREIIRKLYARPQRGERRTGKLTPGDTCAQGKTPKKWWK